jgi:hypothetical protein
VKTSHLSFSEEVIVIPPAGDHFRVLLAERRLEDRQRPPKQRFGFCILLLLLIEHGQVIQGHGHIRMIPSQDLFLDRQRPLVEALGFGSVASS